MKKIVLLVLFTSLFVSCVSVTEKKIYSFAPFVSPVSIIESVGQNLSYLKRIDQLLETKDLIMSNDYSECDYFLFFSFTINEVDSGNYSFKREYDYLTKTTTWIEPSGETKSALTLTITLYDALDLTEDGLYTIVKEVSSEVDVSDNELKLQAETIIETYLPLLLKTIDEAW